jgi:DNA-binding HxlR family transcriptional regulator
MNSDEKTNEAADDSWRCPMSVALDMFGDRWSLILIRDMMFLGKRRYSEFLASNEGISTNILASRLKRLQQLELVEKFADPDNAKTAIYLLSDRGLNLLPILLEVMRWGRRIDSNSKISPEVADALANGGEPLTREVERRTSAERNQLSSPMQVAL